MIFCFGGSLKTYTKFVCLESVCVGQIDTLDTHKYLKGHTVTIIFRFTSIFHTGEKLIVEKVPSYDCR